MTLTLTNDRDSTDIAFEPPAVRIGKYTVIRTLGRGATSEVFLARDDLGREVAIKRMQAVTDGQEAVQQARFFSSEVALVGRLHHPNVVSILDAVADPDGPYVVMEYVEGTTLRDFCTPDRLIALDLVVEIGFKCAMAMDHLTRQGLVHRDLKPANILCTLRNDHITNVKLTDFGSVFNARADQTQVMRVGSLAYCAPEQIDGADVSAQSDMYSLAAVLYHLISGHAPFEASTPSSLIQKIGSERPTDLQLLREGVSPALNDLVQRGLSKKASDRFTTWNDFARSLADLVTNHAVPRGGRQQVVDSERFTLLRSLEFFQNFDDVAVWEVVHRGQWQRLPFGHALFSVGEEGQTFHVIAKGEVEVRRDDKVVAELGAGTTVGEMAYLAPSEALRRHSAAVTVKQAATVVSFTPESLQRLSSRCQNHFDKAFITVLVRRLHAAHQQMQHPRRIM